MRWRTVSTNNLLRLLYSQLHFYLWNVLFEVCIMPGNCEKKINYLKNFRESVDVAIIGTIKAQILLTSPCFCLKLKNWSRLENIEVEKYKPRAAIEITEFQRLHFAMKGSFVLLKHLYFPARFLVNLRFLLFLSGIVVVQFQFLIVQYKNQVFKGRKPFTIFKKSIFFLLLRKYNILSVYWKEKKLKY